MSSALLCNSASATQSWFEVEVILFERLGETSSEQFISAIKQFNLNKSLTVQDDAVYGTLNDCPTLTQFERFSLLEKPEITPLVDPATPLLTEGSITQAVIPAQPLQELEDKTSIEIAPIVEAEITQCIAPDDSILQNAFELQAQRIKDNELIVKTNEVMLPENLTSSTTNLSPIDTAQAELTSPDNGMMAGDSLISSLNEAPALEEIIFDPTTYVPYPVDFAFNGTAYQSVPKQAPIKKVPLTIKHTFEVVSNIEGVDETAITNTLVHDPDKPYLLDEAHLEMTQLVKKFRWQKSTKPLLHIGWRQPMLARHLAKPIHLFGGKDFSTDYDLLGNDKHTVDTFIPEEADDELNTSLNNAYELNVDTTTDPIANININDIVTQLTADTKPSALPIWQLDGLLKIYLNRFLFIESEFDLRKVEQIKQDKILESDDVQLEERLLNQPVSLIKLEQQPQDELETQWVSKLTSHPMKQHRRVRSKEIHYFDHPNMGMVIQIRRFKIPASVNPVAESSTP